MKMGGRFTLSDDSHGIEQVGTNYAKALEFIERTRIENLVFLERNSESSGGRLDETTAVAVPLAELQQHQYWRKAA